MDLTCPYCLYDVANNKNLLPRLPQSGDYIICYSCGELSSFTPAWKLEKANVSDLPAALKKEVEVYQHLVKCAHFVHCPPNNLQ